MEYFDIYNEDGSSAEYTARRDEAHKKGLWHKTVHVWIVRENNFVLLQKRSLSKEVFPGLWDISCAGHIDAGELSLDAAIRELNEELGIRTSKDELQFLFATRQNYFQTDPLIIDNELVDVFLLKSPRDIAVMNCNDEVTDLKYVAVSALTSRILEDVAPHEMEYLQLEKFLREQTLRS
jgi:isopentenyl-diphosphate Delta-isomerase